MAKATRKKAKKKTTKTKKAFQKIIDLLDNGSASTSTRQEPISTLMDIYWAEDSEVGGASGTKQTGS
jgi:hypothetical protein